MISRSTLFLDRLALAVLAVVLIAAGAFGVVDERGDSPLVTTTDTSEVLGVHTASGALRRDWGQAVADLRATIEPEANLSVIAASADQVSAQLAQALGRADLRASIVLKVARRGTTLPRVA